MIIQARIRSTSKIVEVKPVHFYGATDGVYRRTMYKDINKEYTYYLEEQLKFL